MNILSKTCLAGGLLVVAAPAKNKAATFNVDGVFVEEE